MVASPIKRNAVVLYHEKIGEHILSQGAGLGCSVPDSHGSAVTARCIVKEEKALCLSRSGTQVENEHPDEGYEPRLDHMHEGLPSIGANAPGTDRPSD